MRLESSSPDARKRNQDEADKRVETTSATSMLGRKAAAAAASTARAAAAAPTAGPPAVAAAPAPTPTPLPPLASPPPPPPILSHASFGSTCPQAPVVFFNHGWPGSRLGAAMLHRAALRLNVRVVGVDRPGFGGTPFCATHDFESWARRLAGLADQLGARRYAVLGVSGGGPFALAAATHAPDPARVSGLGLLCPVAPTKTVVARPRAAGWCCGAGGGVDGEEMESAAAAATTTPTTATTASWALRAAERHPRTARAVLLVARALLASSSSVSLTVGGLSSQQHDASTTGESEKPPQPKQPPWPARLLQRAAMGKGEADAGGEAAPAAAADIWHAVAEGLRGGGRGMLHEIRLVSRAGSLSSLASSASLSPSPSLPPSSPTPGSPLAPSLSSLSPPPPPPAALGTSGGGGGGSGDDLLFLGGGGALPLASPLPPPRPFVAFCWHGTDDKVAPPALAEHYYGRLAGCEFRAFEGETHTSLVLGRLGEALGELVRRGRC